MLPTEPAVAVAPDSHIRAKLVVCRAEGSGDSRVCREFESALVDTGATHTTISPAAANALGLGAGKAVESRVADGRKLDSRIVAAQVCIGDPTKQGEAVCVDAPVTVLEGARPLIGQSTLRAMKAQLNVAAGTFEVSGRVAKRED